jgi:hypothetical protein
MGSGELRPRFSVKMWHFLKPAVIASALGVAADRVTSRPVCRKQKQIAPASQEAMGAAGTGNLDNTA